MAIIKTIPRGQSLTITYILPEDYDMSRIVNMETVIGQTVFDHVIDGQSVIVRLKSSDTQPMFGQQQITLMIEDAIFGVQKPYSGIINVGVSYSKYSSEAVTGLSSVVIPIVIDETILTAGDILYNYFRCKSPYEIAVDNGYQGTEEEFNFQLGNFENLAEDAEQAKEDAEAAAQQTALDVIQTGADRVQTGLDVVQTGADRVQTGLDVIQTGEDRVQTGLDRIQTGLDVIQTGEDVIQTAADRVQTGLDRIATGADRVQTGLDRVATGADRVQTGLDKTATAADRVQTGLDKTATAADRVQTGLDRVATGADVVLSAAARDKAQQWAENPEDAPVETGKFSALHWAAKAQESAESVAGANALTIQNTAEIASIENIINSMNPNQENRVTVSGVDTISLPKTAANTGMQAQVFGQSAENLVVNGDFRNGTTGWIAGGGVTGFAVVGGIAEFTATAANGAIRRVYNLNVSDIFYLKSKLKADSNQVQIQLFLSASPFTNTIGVFHSGSNSFETLSGRGTVGSTAEYTLRVIDRRTSDWTKVFADDIMLINLTATFGAGNEPTKDQCDLLFANYFEGTDNVLSTGRVRSVGKNLFDRTNVVLNATIDASGVQQASTTSNATRLIRVQPSTAYIFSGKATASNVSFYDRTGVFISSSSVANASVTSPATAYYVRFGVVYAQIDTCQMERGTVATTYSPFIQSALYLQSADLRSNGLIKDEIRKGTNGYELIKRVGVGSLVELISGGDFETANVLTLLNDTGGAIATYSINTTNPISGTKDGRIVVTSAGTNPLRPILALNHGYAPKAGERFILQFSYKVNSGTWNSAYNNGVNVIFSTQYTSGESGTSTVTFNSAGTSNGIGNIYFGNASVCDVQIDNISFKRLAETDGLRLNDSYIELGSNIHYTLATPTITPVAHAGLLNSNSNGTTYFEPVVADAGVYSTSIAIQLTDYPISSLERIIKRFNGVDIELPTSTAVIAGDGLSFTHPNLASGDLVMFTYNYNRESIGRSMTLTHYDSRFYPKWDDEYPSGQWVDAAAQAAPNEVNVTIAGVATRKQSFGTGDAKSNIFEIRHGSAIEFINSGEMPLEFHIHAMPSTNNAGTAIFTFNWCYSPPNAAPIAGTPLDVTFVIAANRQYWHLLAGANLALPSGGFAIGGKIEFTVTRKAAGNTYADAVLFDKCALHRPINSMGTINVYSN